IPEGVKTAESDSKVTQDFVNEHLKIGVDALNELKNNGLTVKHLKF
ncbi:MAG: AMP nucleosidase, partial [Bacteroidia bacterium]|nr:AMP nucleosidase [Bacteroidia bacterium]